MNTRVICGMAVGTLLAIMIPGAITASASSPTGCAGPAPGGEWRSYGHDYTGSRHQSARTTITPTRAAGLAPAWIFSITAIGGSGTFDNSPIVADGCVFVASNTGTVAALNAATGHLVWKAQLADPVESTPVVANGRVYLSVDRVSSPYVVALAEKTGQLLWNTQIDKQFGSDTNSSPVDIDHMIIVGISGASAEAGTTLCPAPFAPTFGCGGGPDSRLLFRGSYVFLNDRTGRLIHKAFVISNADFKRGFSGGGVWSTAAVDPRTHYAYFGTGNPFSAHEHPNTNALIKVDIDPHRKTFGSIVGVHHGTDELYAPGATYKPVCGIYVDVFTCDPPDFDFGASPQLFDVKARELVGDMQKSGVYHVADAKTMQGVWDTTVGGPVGQFGGEATASYDGTSIYTAGNAPGVMSALNPTTGSYRWVMPIADGIHFQSVSTADGVTYATDTRGFLDIWNSKTGAVLQMRYLGSDTNQPGYEEFSAGEAVAIARNTVYCPAGGYLVAYR